MDFTSSIKLSSFTKYGAEKLSVFNTDIVSEIIAEIKAKLPHAGEPKSQYYSTIINVIEEKKKTLTDGSTIPYFIIIDHTILQVISANKINDTIANTSDFYVLAYDYRGGNDITYEVGVNGKPSAKHIKQSVNTFFINTTDISAIQLGLYPNESKDLLKKYDDHGYDMDKLETIFREFYKEMNNMFCNGRLRSAIIYFNRRMNEHCDLVGGELKTAKFDNNGPAYNKFVDCTSLYARCLNNIVRDYERYKSNYGKGLLNIKIVENDGDLPDDSNIKLEVTFTKQECEQIKVLMDV